MQIFGKLLGATLAAMLITLAIGGLGWFGLEATRAGLDTVIRVRTPQIHAIDQMVETLNTIRVDEFALVNSRLEPERREQILAGLGQASSRLAEGRAAFAALPMTPRQAELWSETETALDSWAPKHRRMIDLVAANRIVNVELLPGILAGHLLDHRQWFDELRRAVGDGKPFQQETSPLACGLGRWLPTYQSDDSGLQELLAGLRGPHERLHEASDAIAGLLARGRAREARALLARDGAPALRDFQAAIKSTRSYVDERLTDFDVAINYVFGDVARAFDASVAALKATAAEVSAQAVTDSDQATATGTRSQTIALLATVVGILCGLVGGILLARHMTRRLRSTVQMLGELEQGHLDVRLELAGGDEISAMSRAMDTFAEDLEERVRGVHVVAVELAAVGGQIDGACHQVTEAANAQSLGVLSTRAAVQEIAASVRQVSEGVTVLSGASSNGTASVLEMAATSEELAGSAENLARIADEVGSSITEVASSIQQVADNSLVLKESADATAASVTQLDAALGEVESAVSETAQVSAGVRRDVEAGQSAMATAITGSHEIRQASQVTATAINNLSARVQDIGKILGMIDDVTDQTRLLALNAAIIAAQAGVHGQGFAVVAKEIRELSDRASQSTGEIALVIDSLQQETEKVVAAVQRTENRVVEGEELALASGAALSKIVAGIHEIDHRMERIGRATGEQAESSRVIGAAMEKVAQMVDHTVLATGEQSKAARTITTAVERLRSYALQVKTSAREQSNGSKVLAAAIEEIDGMIRQIGHACEEQTRGSQQISRAVEEIHHSAEANLAASVVLAGAVASQKVQIGILNTQMGSFRIGERPASGAELPPGSPGQELLGTTGGGQRSAQRPEGPADHGKFAGKTPHPRERGEDGARRGNPPAQAPPAANS